MFAQFNLLGYLAALISFTAVFTAEGALVVVVVVVVVHRVLESYCILV